MMKQSMTLGMAGVFGLLAAIGGPASVETASAAEPVTCDAYWEGWYYKEGAGCLFGGASGCSNPFPYESEEECRADNPAAYPPPVSLCDPDLPSDPLSVLGASVVEDTLRMRVRYGGGCREHQFTLCWGGGFAESHPVQARLAIQHDAQDDLCRALVTKEIAFDIELLKERFWEMYRQRSGVMLLDIEGYEPLVRYRF